MSTQASNPSGQRRGWLGQVKWYIASVMGDNHYERYVERHRVLHPGEPLMSKREYWRERTDSQDRNPKTRCC